MPRIDFVRLYYDKYNIGFSNIENGLENHEVKGNIDIKEMLRYKYIISIEGNDKDSGLNWKLASKSIVLMRKPIIESWLMEGLLKEYVHYVPINNDFSDLTKILEWCNNNDNKCREIVENANNFMKQFEDDKKEKIIHDKILQYYKNKFIFK